jgi:hypothetical protein
MITRATRIQGESFSLIDHVFTNTKNVVPECGVLVSDISDHFFTCVSLPSHKKPKPPNNTKKRIFSDENVNNFRNDLNNINWNVILNDNDVNSSFEKCWDIFNTLYDLHFPLKNVKINKNVHKINNFMTKGLLVSRKNKML